MEWMEMEWKEKIDEMNRKPGFTGFLPSFTGFDRVSMFFSIITGFYRVLLSFTWDHWVVIGI